MLNLAFQWERTIQVEHAATQTFLADVCHRQACTQCDTGLCIYVFMYNFVFYCPVRVKLGKESRAHK